MKQLLLLTILCCIFSALHAQKTTPAPVQSTTKVKPKPKNLVLNPSFEIRKDTTLNWLVQNPIERAAAWESPNKSNAQVYTSVKKGDKYFVYDPYGADWNFAARTGKNVAGINVLFGNPKYGKRSYIQGELKEPLTVGQKYYFGFWVHYHCQGANNIGIAFLPERAKLDSTAEILPFDPASYQNKITNYDKERTWTFVRDSFIAFKPFQYFVIGNFFPDSLTKVQQASFNHHFAFIDDIVVVEAENPVYSKDVDPKKEEVKWVRNTVTAKSVNSSIILKNIYFDYNKATLLDESNNSLNELLEQMNAQPKLKIKIKGHTSTEGDAAYNLKLSQNRAKAVRDYLVKNGVKTERVQYQGYGETVPIGSNDTEEDRARNRRVEFEILEK